MRTLHVSVREARMCVERTLLTCGIPSGAVHGVRETILLSEALGLGGFKYLLEKHDALQWRLFEKIKVQTLDDDALAVDAGGLHAWLILPTIVDLAIAEARRSGTSLMKVSNVAAAGELKVAEGLARRYGAEAAVSANSIAVKNASRPVTAEQWDPLLLHAIRYGFDVEETTWRAVHKLSNGALAPDSVVSRRHAGPVVLAEDGTIKGRLPSDDDFDMNMLKKVAR